MTFNSIQFLVFFPCVVFVYYILPYRWRWGWLLLASCYFYMAFIPGYILILFLLIGIDYTAAILIERTRGYRRKLLLYGSILATCSVLFIFKYFNFFNANLSELARLMHWNYPVPHLSLILPLGLSFHTFQSLSYVVEVYRGNWKAERHFGIYALYVMFFPQLVSGPIERPGHMLPQLREHHDFDYARVTDGLKLMLWGMFQKVVIADHLAIVVNQVYNTPSDYQGLIFVIATVFFAFQIYCDFSGYSDIAIGAAMVLGIQLTANFKHPYFAVSIAEFWRRWHISLSTWFRDYVYIPLGGNRVSFHRWQFNIFIAFLLSGLWHGANETFVLWGALHGFYYLFSSGTKKGREEMILWLGLNCWPGLHRVLQSVVTFGLVCFAWIFFRANSFYDAVYIIRHLASGWNQPFIWGSAAPGSIGMQETEFYRAVFLIFFLLGAHGLQSFLSRRNSILSSRGTLFSFISQQPLWLRWGGYVLMTMAVMNLGITADNKFIYFQF